jgi:hypothetical protein
MNLGAWSLSGVTNKHFHCQLILFQVSLGLVDLRLFFELKPLN